MVIKEEEKILLETESFRAYETSEENKEIIKNANKIKMKYKDLEMDGIDFQTLKVEDRIIMHYKAKDSGTSILYYIPEEVKQQDKKLAMEFLHDLENMGFLLVDVMDTLKSVYAEKHRLGL